MARPGNKKIIFNGNSKLEYSENGESNWEKVYSITEWPDPDGDISYIDTTDQDCKQRETQMPGLQSASEYVFPIDIEQVTNENANVKILHDMEKSGKTYNWKWTYLPGIVYTFQSEVRIKLKGSGNNELSNFDLILTPINEPVRTISVVEE